MLRVTASDTTAPGPPLAEGPRPTCSSAAPVHGGAGVLASELGVWPGGPVLVHGPHFLPQLPAKGGASHGGGQPAGPAAGPRTLCPPLGSDPRQGK